MKRSNRISLVLMASISTAALASCDDGSPPPRPAPAPDVAVTTPAYTNKAECIADGNTDQACTQLAALVASAPQFNSQQSCEAQFGPQACRPQPAANGGSGDIFMPMMMGYMLGSIGNGSSYDYGRDYNRYRDSSYYRRDRDRTYNGYYAPGGRGYRAPTPYSNANRGKTSVPNTVQTAPRPVTVAPPATQRGGFGERGVDKAGLRNSASPNAINRGSNYQAPRATTRSPGGSSRGGFGSSGRGGFGGGG
jgi:uncharacterized protein YgiB involved in biofilm formation